jgi:hypothetical protein
VKNDIDGSHRFRQVAPDLLDENVRRTGLFRAWRDMAERASLPGPGRDKIRKGVERRIGDTRNDTAPKS